MGCKHGKLMLFFVLASQCISCISVGIPSPFLPSENKKHGQKSTVTGFMLGIVPFVQCLVNGVMGTMSGRVGVRNILCGGMLTIALCTATFGTIEFIPADQQLLYNTIAFAIRVILGLGTSAVFTSAYTFISDTFPDDSTQMLSITGALGGVGMISGPAMGSGLFKIGGFWLVFVGSGAIMLLLAISMFVFLPKTGGCLSKPKTTSSTSVPYRKILLNPRTLIGLIASMYSAAKWSAIDPILEPQLRNAYGFTEDQSALVFLLLSGTYVIVTPFIGKVVGKKYCIDSLMLMIVGLSISLVAFTFAGPCPWLNLQSDRLWLLLLCLCVMGLTNSLLYVPAQDVTFDVRRYNLPADANTTAVRGFVSGIWNTSYAIGTSLGMIFSGSFAQLTSWAWTMTFYAGACLFIIILIVVVKTYELFKQQEVEESSVNDERRPLLSDSP